MAVATVQPDIFYAWQGPSLVVVNTRGECGGDRNLSGYYFRETRFLRTLRLEINGEPPWLCEEWLGLQAGMPLYPAFFGREAVRAGRARR